MDQPDEMTETRQELEAALAAGRSVYADDLHLRLQELAEAAPAEALPLLVRALGSADPGWRAEAAQNLGFHYDLRRQPDALSALRRLLREDPEATVRQAAAAVLPLHSTWPDAALTDALRDDRDGLVGLLVFEGLLKLAGLPPDDVKRAMRRARSGKLAVSVEGLRQVVGEGAAELGGGERE